MPKLEFKGEGCGVDPRRRTDKDAPLTADNLVIELSDHCFVDTERRTRLLTCGCDPEKAAKGNHRRKRCDCKESKCSLLCGCRGRCYLGPPPSAVTATDNGSEGGDAEGGGGESDGGKESDGHASGEVGVRSLTFRLEATLVL